MLTNHQVPQKNIYHGTVYIVYDLLIKINRTLHYIPNNDKLYALMPIEVDGQPILLNAITLPEKFWPLLQTYTGVKPILDLLTLPETVIKLLTMGLLTYLMSITVDNNTRVVH